MLVQGDQEVVSAVGIDAPALCDGVGTNEVSERAVRRGDPETAFARARHIPAVTVRMTTSSTRSWSTGTWASTMVGGRSRPASRPTATSR
ncbi:hypothetical protein FF100_33285 [Methylobacterium terricola]|uniref:Uncharacterized protein n=1 Tax=Methylobacterium terricola TaxID=2583531 RepID=A0A5C4L928_9HYPH|nr:hypothetical protein FF100_33285 [Methylobacterium terricola]